MRSLKVATVFSGIGAFEQSLLMEKIPHEVVFACDNGERELDPKVEEDLVKKTKGLDDAKTNLLVKKAYDALHRPNYVKKSFLANYALSEEGWHEDIRFVKGEDYKDQIDIFVGGSPCQSFSQMGKRLGLEDTRGTLFYEFARLVKEIQPKVFIYENVPGMLVHDHGRTWEVIKGIFSDLDYDIHIEVLNAMDYGLPQNRKRLFAVGFKKKTDFSFEPKTPLFKKASDYLEKEVDAKFYLGKKGFEFVTNPKYYGRAKVNADVIRTQKANQQFNWNGDFVFEPLGKVEKRKDVMARAYVGEWNGQRGVCRQMTHRECLRLMGYPDSFKIVVPNVQAYRQAGNSIAVDVMRMVVRSILRTGVFE